MTLHKILRDYFKENNTLVFLSLTLISMNYTALNQIRQNLSTFPACTPYEELVISISKATQFL